MTFLETGLEALQRTRLVSDSFKVCIEEKGKRKG
jgi:hypothetical protein